MDFKNVVRNNRVLYHFALSFKGFIIGLKGLLSFKKGSINHILSTFSFLFRTSTVLGRPVNITIEPTNFCNLKCAVCETGANVLNRKKLNMTLDSFKDIVDKIYKHTNTLLFYFMGEPFLNAKAYEMVKYAKGKGIPFITTCTNGDLIDPEKLIDCNIDEVSFQIGGMTQKTHEVYRGNSNLQRVLSNLKRTVAAKRKTGSNTRILCGFILMKHNEHEVSEFLDTMKEIGVDSADVIDPCVRNIKQGKDLLPIDKKHWIYDPEAFDKGILRPKTMRQNTCPWIYYSITIQADGNIVPCCRDSQGDFVMGNILEQSLWQIWNGNKFRRFRSTLLLKQKNIKICSLCSSYDATQLK